MVREHGSSTTSRARRALLALLAAGVLAVLLLCSVTQHKLRLDRTAPAHAPAAPLAASYDRRRAGEPSAEEQRPRMRVYFLKTHKCASTSVQRIILAYAIKHNASIALPLHGENVFFPSSFRPNLAKRTCSHPTFDVMAAHTRFDANAKRFMQNDTFFVSVVRDPAEQMESAYHYFLGEICDDQRRQNATFEEYMSTVARGNVTDEKATLEYSCGIGRLQFLQLYDFGLDLSPPPTREVVAHVIEEIDKIFDLVLVVERLDEGLVLMRDMLGWSTRDMLHLKSNFRLRPRAHMSKEVRTLAYGWNWADKMLYDHFRAKMDAAIQQRKPYLAEQVLELQRQRVALYEYCIAAVERDTVRKKGKSRSVDVSAYVLSDAGRQNASCQIAAMSELQLFRYMNAARPVCSNAR